MKTIYTIFATTLLMLAASLGASSHNNFYSGPNATVNVNDSVVIRLNDYEGKIKWQKSLDFNVWENIPGATWDTLLFVANTTSYFRAEVISGECDPFYSDTTLIIVIEGGVFDIDGNFYPSVIIRDQEWMAENLKTTKYRNGTPIEYIGADDEAWQSNTTGAYAWYDNDIVWKDSYGALYNWHAADNSNGLCPAGWHVPSDAEWTELVDYVVTQGFPNSNLLNGAGNALKSCRQVSSPLGGDCATVEHPRWDLHSTHYGTDEFGFSALPGGYRHAEGFFAAMGRAGLWWSSTELDAASLWYRAVAYSHGYVYINNNGFFNEGGMSVRCVRD